MGMIGGCSLGMGLVGPAMLALLGGLLGGAVLRWRASDPGGRAPVAAGVAEDGALALLRERFARGEIDQSEYERRRDTLARAGGWL